jgi:prepilin-type N-terminal cleavage/methylation domain-containing protein
MKYYHEARSSQMRGQSGFTLLEVLIAMAVFMVAVAGSFAMYARSVDNNQLSLISTRLTNLAYEQMDTVLAIPYNDPQLLPGAQAPVRFTFPEHNVEGELFWSVLPEGSAVRNAKIVTLNIFWRRGVEHARGPFNLTFLKPEML